MRTRVGYAGGTTRDPTYHDIADHAEAFQLDFDPRMISYDALVALVTRNMRPGGRGQYRHAVFTREPFYLAEDYHQKYYLRHDAALLAALDGYTPRQLVDSTIAARLNALAAGHDVDVSALGLSLPNQGRLRARCR